MPFVGCRLTYIRVACCPVCSAIGWLAELLDVASHMKFPLPWAVFIGMRRTAWGTDSEIHCAFNATSAAATAVNKKVSADSPLPNRHAEAGRGSLY